MSNTIIYTATGEGLINLCACADGIIEFGGGQWPVIVPISTLPRDARRDAQ